MPPSYVASINGYVCSRTCSFSTCGISTCDDVTTKLTPTNGIDGTQSIFSLSSLGIEDVRLAPLHLPSCTLSVV